MEKTRLKVQWLSKGKSIRKRDLKQIGSYVPPPPSSEGRASPVSNPTASSGHKVGSSHNTEGAVVSGPQPAAVGLAPAPDCRAKLPVEHSAHLTQGKHFFPAGIQSGSSMPEWDLPVFQLSWPFWRNLWVPTCWALSGLRSSSGKCKQRKYHASRGRDNDQDVTPQSKPLLCVSRSRDTVTIATEEKK